MAAYTTTLYDAQAALATNVYESNLVPDIAGRMRIARISYALASTEAAAEIITLCKLPVGSIPVPGSSYIVCEDPGTALILDIGTAADPDGWGDGVDCQAAGIKPFVFSTVTPAFALTATPTVAENIICTVDTATTLTAAKKVIFHLAYLLPGGNLPAIFQSS